jgi:RNA polymerase sigma-70 factor (ECF subfamily)
MSSRSRRRLLPAFLAYYDELLGTWARRLQSRHDAEDVVHDTVVRMLEANAAAILKPRAYVHQTARNLVTDAYRRRTLHETVPLDEIEESPAPDADLDAAVHASEMVSTLEAALAELPLKCRQVFVWQRIEGMTQAEIGKRLGISKNMVEKYIIRAMRHLRERMADFNAH